MKCPCKGCDNRKLGCHGRCKEYHAWQNDNERKKKWLAENTTLVNDAAMHANMRNVRDRARGWGKRRIKNYD